jgi:hypothetical protein
MNLVELYAAMPVEKHGDIKVSDDKVVVKTGNGTDEYLIDGNGELYLVSSDTDVRSDLAAIKGKLGI